MSPGTVPGCGGSRRAGEVQIVAHPSAARQKAARAPTRPVVLVVEDERDIVELLQYNLEKDRYQVLVAPSGEAALDLLERQAVDLVILDLMLPGIDGFEVSRRMRAEARTSRIPILMLTARAEEVDIVTGLELGAEDYVTKPFSPRVLMARVRTILRRREGSEEPPPRTLRHGELEIDSGRHEVRVGGVSIPLTLTEFKLLLQLAGRPGWVFTRDQLLDAVQGPESYVLDRTVDVHVGSLRRKLGEFGHRIETVRGVGYKLSDLP